MFRCACYPNLHPYNQYKFVFRSTCCLFLGYSIRHAGYICLTQDGKTIVSRHVVFDEKSFPYKDHAGKFVVSSRNAQVPTVIAPTLSVIHSPHTDNILSHNDTHSVAHASSITPSTLH